MGEGREERRFVASSPAKFSNRSSFGAPTDTKPCWKSRYIHEWSTYIIQRRSTVRYVPTRPACDLRQISMAIFEYDMALPLPGLLLLLLLPTSTLRSSLRPSVTVELPIPIFYPLSIFPPSLYPSLATKQFHLPLPSLVTGPVIRGKHLPGGGDTHSCPASHTLRARDPSNDIHRYKSLKSVCFCTVSGGA